MNRLRFLLLVLLAAGAPAGAADARQASTALTCAAAAQMVRTKGAVLFDTSPTTFDRYVRDASFCVNSTIAQPAWIPTRDQRECRVGYTCDPEVPFLPSDRF